MLKQFNPNLSNGDQTYSDNSPLGNVYDSLACTIFPSIYRLKMNVGIIIYELAIIVKYFITFQDANSSFEDLKSQVEVLEEKLGKSEVRIQDLVSSNAKLQSDLKQFEVQSAKTISDLVSFSFLSLISLTRAGLDVG